MSSATHPCPYIAYFGPIHPSSSSSSASEASNFSNHWNGPSVPSEMPSSYAFPAVDLHYQNWEHHSPPPFSTTNNRVAGADQPSVASVAQRSATRVGSELPRSGSVMHPFLVGHRYVSTLIGCNIFVCLFVVEALFLPQDGKVVSYLVGCWQGRDSNPDTVVHSYLYHLKCLPVVGVGLNLEEKWSLALFSDREKHL